ncbi:hypothetical protein AARAC_007098 [Aspergillus arachidicola]|uniref:Heterokaryon incompatibility domain-containing protein n=1 Tax=Aspergillus arachidicola TaxID=656916 RepID=A0A2G7FXY1_9EURO|nr:hypothetical protein AARAC_007098 [Aspergillus arachidicola]
MLAIPSSSIMLNSAIRNRSSSLPLHEAIASGRRWLDECLDGHELCPKDTQPSSYPDLLLELDGSTVRVISPVERKISGPYVALSYCCRDSNSDFLRLSASNKEALEKGISCFELPTAFREAAELVHGMSIHYLWIDALCKIPQSQSHEEHNSEWAELEAIYTNSIFNLALATVENPTESCLGGCPSHVGLPFQVETSGLIGDDVRTVVPYEYHPKSLYHQPLGCRAESMQERFWSPRVLSIGLGELFWDCTQLQNASESLPQGPAAMARWTKLRQTFIPRTSDRKKLEEFWWLMVEEYSDCELAHPETDKLAGLSYIANQLASALDDVYIAGHFWKTLPYSLNWRVDPQLAPDRERSRKPQRIANMVNNKVDERTLEVPSWSWASMDGTVYISRPWNFASLADVEAYTLAPVMSNKLIKGARSVSLTIRTYCLEVHCTDGKPVIPQSLWTPLENFHWFRAKLDDEQDTPANGTRLLLAALIEDDRMCTWEGLVLQQVEAGEDTYQRIGHFQFHRIPAEEPRETWQDDYRSMLDQRRAITLV